MQETEKAMKCPYCYQKISMILDLSENGTHSYVEDCEVCCRPIQLDFTVLNHELGLLSISKIQ